MISTQIITLMCLLLWGKCKLTCSYIYRKNKNSVFKHFVKTGEGILNYVDGDGALYRQRVIRSMVIQRQLNESTIENQKVSLAWCPQQSTNYKKLHKLFFSSFKTWIVYNKLLYKNDEGSTKKEQRRNQSVDASKPCSLPTFKFSSLESFNLPEKSPEKSPYSTISILFIDSSKEEIQRFFHIFLSKYLTLLDQV